MTASARFRSPNFSTASRATSHAEVEASASRNQANGSFERELDRVAIERLDLVHVLERRPIAVALDAEESLVGVLHVVSRQLTSIDRRLRMPAHAAPQLEDVGRVASARPRLGDVCLDRIGARPHRGPRFDLQEPAVRERQHRHRGEGKRLVWIEPNRIEPSADPKNPAALRGLGGRGAGSADVDGRTTDPRGESGARELQRIAATDTFSIRHGWTSVPLWVPARSAALRPSFSSRGSTSAAKYGSSLR